MATRREIVFTQGDHDILIVAIARKDGSLPTVFADVSESFLEPDRREVAISIIRGALRMLSEEASDADPKRR